jgi:hypothetical protein
MKSIKFYSPRSPSFGHFLTSLSLISYLKENTPKITKTIDCQILIYVVVSVMYLLYLLFCYPNLTKYRNVSTDFRKNSQQNFIRKVSTDFRKNYQQIFMRKVSTDFRKIPNKISWEK